MHFFISSDNSKAIYLLENQQYSVGRKDTDILIKDDTSISRKHATIHLKNGKVYITDLNAKYNTFVNNTKLEPSKPIELNVNDQIQFGILRSIYMLKEQQLTVTTSGLTPEEKKNLHKIIKRLGGTLVDHWSKECSHLIVKEIVLTLKVLCALVERQPIVNQGYCTDFMINFNEGIPPPDVNNYKPMYSDSMLSKNIDFSEKPSRKTLFKGKVFVFKDIASKARVKIIVELAGGTCICWNDKQLTHKDFLSNHPQYLLIQDDSKDFSINESFSDMANHLHTVGRRSIPIQEIATAIVTASCEKDCNPDFDRAGMLIKGKEEILFTSNILAFATQTQNYEIEEKPSLTVPETMKPNFSNPVVSIEHKKDTESTRSKREGEVIGNEEKRIRLENMEDKETYSALFLGDSSQSKNVITSTQKGSCENVTVPAPKQAGSMLNESNEIFSKCSELSDSKIFRRIDNEQSSEKLNISRKKIKLDNDLIKNEWISTKQNVNKSVLIDLTQESNNVQSPIIPGRSCMPSTSKENHEMQHRSNPFGFQLCTTKSKNSGTSMITDASKQNVSSLRNNIDESIREFQQSPPNEKSKSNTRPNFTKKKQTLLINPVSVKKFKGNESGDSSPFQKPSVRGSATGNNPFGPIGGTKQTTNQRPSERGEARNSMPYPISVTIVDDDMENKTRWLSKSRAVENEVSRLKNAMDDDDNVRSFHESFINCVIVEKKPLTVKRAVITNAERTNVASMTNFKKFRKIKPLHVQTTIVPRSRFRDVTVC